MSPVQTKLSPIVLIAAIAGVAMFFAGVIVLTKPEAFRSKTATPVDRDFIAMLALHPEFNDWVGGWAGVDEYLKSGEFAQVSSEALTPATVAGRLDPADAAAPRQSRFIASPNGQNLADLLMGFGQTPVEATVRLSLDGGAFTNVLRRAETDYFQTGLWLDDNVFASFGRIAERRDDGGQICVATGAAAPVCLYRLTIDVFDLAAHRHDLYQSEKHGFATDPFAAATRERWLASLSSDERLAAGIVDVAALPQSARGTVTDISANGFSLRPEDGAGEPVAVVAHAKTIVVDESGAVISLSGLRPSATVSVSGFLDSTGRLLASRVALLTAPSLLVTGVPTDAVFPSAGLIVSGEVRRGVPTLAIKLKSRRTGVTLFSQAIAFAPDDAAPWQKFSAFVTSDQPLRASDPLTLVIYDPTNLANGETYQLKASKP